MITALAIFALAFSGSFIFAGFETGLVSVNRLKVEHAESNGDKVARRFSSLLNQQSRVVATVLIGNNVALVGMESSFSSILGFFSDAVPPVAETLILAVVALIFCELLPKSLFRIYSFKMTHFFTNLIWALNLLFAPLTFIIEKISSIAGSDDGDRLVVAELTAVAAEGGRIQELDQVVPHLTETVLSAEGVSLRDFLADVEKLSLTGLKAAFMFTQGDFANVLFRPEVLFSDSVIEVDGSYYSSRSVLEKILYQ